MTWLNRALSVESKGLATKKATGLGGLHARRQQTESQYYTPEWVGEGIWQLLRPFVEIYHKEQKEPISVVDIAIGSGRLLSAAPIHLLHLYGFDIDERSIEAITDDAAEANLLYEFAHAGMETVELHGFSLALTNPPFSLTLRSPLMQPYPCTHYGEYGPKTNALSHVYALEQALSSASAVVAILPRSMRNTCQAHKRLIAEYVLPSDTFKAEGANVRTSVFIFDRYSREERPTTHKVIRGQEWPSLCSLDIRPKSDTPQVFKVGGVDYSTPVITMSVTQDNRVGLHHHNRKLVLKFRCGLTQAKVLNGLLEGPVIPSDKHRYPKNIRFIGDGKFYLDVYLSQSDPEAAFWRMVDLIKFHGGEPVVSDALLGYFRKLIKRHTRSSMPYRHVVKTSDVPYVEVIAKRSMLLQQGNTKSPVIRKGQLLKMKTHRGEYELEYEGSRQVYRRDVLLTLFDFKSEDSSDMNSVSWKVIHEGLLAGFPELAKQYRAILKQKQIDWLWKPQEDGLIELLIRPYGGISGWQQGTGKARLGLALLLCAPSQSLFVLNSGLIAEMKRELKKIELPEHLWCEIDETTKPDTFRQLNIVSYNRLKKTVNGRKTLASQLRKRFHTVVADEGGILSSENTQQTRAIVNQLGARKLYILDGTPMGNYPQDVLPLAQATAGNGVAHQPYAKYQGPVITAQLLKSASYCERGIDAFREKHLVFEWVTNEFCDNLQEGAKRELPKISQIQEFRQWLGPLVQRRLRDEPDFAPYCACPAPNKEKISIAWDSAHFAHYMDVSLHFANWYRRQQEHAEVTGKKINFMTVLARINAVVKAANSPHVLSDKTMKHYSPLTSKQRYIIEEVDRQVKQGKKTIVVVNSPDVVERLHTRLQERGIDSIRFHGKRDIKTRTLEIDEFRFGAVDVLLMTWVGQRGLNIPQAKTFIFGSRNWSADTESQALDRTQRPDQIDRVEVKYVHLKGSIDEYIDQVVDWKQSAANAGLDWGDGATESEVFSHMDTILNRFVTDILKYTHKDIEALINAA